MNAPLHGHPRFYDLTRAEEDLHSRKNKDYAGGGRPMGNFERVSSILALYPGFPADTNYGVGIIYALKQLDAAMWLLATKREGEVEGVADRLGDISVYAKLVRIMYEERPKTIEAQVAEKFALLDSDEYDLGEVKNFYDDFAVADAAEGAIAGVENYYDDFDHAGGTADEEAKAAVEGAAPEFKAGDRVRVRGYDIPGHIRTVRGGGVVGHVDCVCDCGKREWLALTVLKHVEVGKFKVGDRVKVVTPLHNVKAALGMEGIIQRAYNGFYEVNFGVAVPHNHGGESMSWSVDPDMIEHVH